MAETDATPTPGWRALIAGADQHERVALLWSFLFFFCQLFGYYILRSVRESLIAADGARLLPTVFTSVFICMLALMPLYGALVARVQRRHFMPAVYVIVIGSLIAFSMLLDRSMSTQTATAFAIFLTVINLFTDSVFWSFMADIFVSNQAKRFYAIIAAGGTAGAILGPLATRFLVAHVEVSGLMLISAAFYTLCFGCLLRLIPWARKQELRNNRPDGDQLIGGSIIAGAKVVFRKPALIALMLHMFFGVSIGTFIYNAQAQTVGAMNLSSVDRTQYFAMIDLAMNVSVLLIQVLVTRTLLIRFGVGPLLLIPAIAAGLGMGSIALAQGAMMLAAVQVGTRGLSFSFVKPARETLFTLVDREARYKAKNFIDTVVYRGSDMVTSWSFYALGAVGLGIAGKAGVWFGVALVWLAVVIWLIRITRTMRDQRQVEESQSIPGKRNRT